VRPGLVPASWLSGIVLGAVEEPSALRFESYVNIDNVEAMRLTGARYLIIHRNPSREVRGQPPKKRSKIPSHFAQAFGSVVYEDDWLFVFDLESEM